MAIDGKRFFEVASAVLNAALWGRTLDEVRASWKAYFKHDVPTAEEWAEVTAMTVQQVQERVRKGQDEHDAREEAMTAASLPGA